MIYSDSQNYVAEDKEVLLKEMQRKEKQFEAIFEKEQVDVEAVRNIGWNGIPHSTIT